MILSVLMDRNPKGLGFFNRMKDRQKDLPLPVFDLKVRTFPAGDRILYVLCFQWKILRPALVGLIPLALWFFFKSGVAFWIAVGLFSTEFFLSPLFIYLILRIGLKKYGFKGMARSLDNANALKVIVNGKA